MRHKILIVDDEIHMRNALRMLLENINLYEIYTAANYDEAIKIAKSGVDIVITDIAMPGNNGLVLLTDLKKLDSNIEVIIITAHSSIRSSVDAMKQGAFEYLVKPFENDEFLIVIQNALKLRALTLKNASLQNALEARFKPTNIIGSSDAIFNIFKLIEKASFVDSTALITGESGTGKELVAHAIHYNGTRKAHPFVCINCATLPGNLLESELFGYEKGAFSGATNTKEGKFEQGDKGTIFLDEIGELSVNLQAKLLRAIETKEIERLGKNTPIKIDCRIIAATNKDLKKEIEFGRFREDLFFRLNVIFIKLPPLRERKEDLPELIDYILKQKSLALGKSNKKIHTDAMNLLLNYDYPGNVRELENIIERAIIINENGVLGKEDIPITETNNFDEIQNIKLPLENGFTKLNNVSKNLEKDLIGRAIKKYPNMSNDELANFLGTTRRILELRLKEYNIR
jgi:two-component system response regulator AtoC